MLPLQTRSGCHTRWRSAVSAAHLCSKTGRRRRCSLSARRALGLWTTVLLALPRSASSENETPKAPAWRSPGRKKAPMQYVGTTSWLSLYKNGKAERWRRSAPHGGHKLGSHTCIQAPELPASALSLSCSLIHEALLCQKRGSFIQNATCLQLIQGPSSACSAGCAQNTLPAFICMLYNKKINSTSWEQKTTYSLLQAPRTL